MKEEFEVIFVENKLLIKIVELLEVELLIKDELEVKL